ncbi:hypothetical protein OCH239_09315 [Roseivivax halodurans JCM 10272]|uniref:Uncharacterized protein n=1 Tax=Roseivivax halodurans JCM 10272 TaxID=1449350 RepID=X7EC23_9RHOB|nr:hypothetical protein [Roseivivax halodurans]ETX13654.1 hypothetical protein OCH239_09315 [Roseivivax halodurans JCM 10272]
MRPDPVLPAEDDRPIRDIFEDAVSRWEALTGVRRNETRFTLGSLGISEMNRMLDEALKLDPEGTTAYLLLEVFLRLFLEDKTFSAAQIMRDYAKTTGFLQDAERLFSIVQSDRALEVSAQFRRRVRDGLAAYGADRPDVLELVDGPDAIPFLRRDALRSLDKLQAYQFLAGEVDTAHPQVIRHVHMAWSANDLLAAVRDMPVSGVALVLMRDAAHANRSYFAFVMRNGGNVILFTDRRKPVYPGQDDVLEARGSRGVARTYAARENANHFPYQLIPTSFDDKGDVVFERETAPVAHGLRLMPLMEIKDLPPTQAIWVTMMLSLISDRFWKQGWRAPELSYTGEMIRRRELLVEDGNGARLPAAQDYRPITLEDVRVEELTAEVMAEQTSYPPEVINAWLEARYRDRVPSAVLNTWHRNHDEILFLESAQGDRERDGAIAAHSVALTDGIRSMSRERIEKLPFWKKPAVTELEAFSGADFGTEAELQRDRLFIARKNMAAYIQKCADEEFDARKPEVAAWYSRAIGANIDAILPLIAAGPEASTRTEGHIKSPLMGFGEVGDDDTFGIYSRWGWGNEHAFGEYRQRGGKWLCYLTGAVATYRATFIPRDVADISLLTGLPVSEIPDVLHHWGDPSRHSGNHLLNRLDPMDTDLRNPWNRKNLLLDVNVYLSKRGLKRVRSESASPVSTRKGTTA